MYKFLVPVFFACPALYAAETSPMADACNRLLSALEQETAALVRMTSAAEVEAALPDLRASLKALEELLVVDASELWIYIDNTDGVKQPIVDELQRLALQFARVESEGFYNNMELKSLLAPQVAVNPEAQKAKREKLREIDHDED